MASILVVREFDDFSRILAEAGFSVINCPTIVTVALENTSDFERRISALEIYDGIFLTSAKAAEIFRRKLRERKNRFGGKVYVLGRRGFDLLKDESLDLFFDETANTAREMLDKIAPEDIRHKRFLFARGEKSLRVVPDFLKTAATVDEAIVYKTEKVAVEVDKINKLGEKFGSGEIACACFFSPSAAQNFIEQFGAAFLHQTIIATIGKTTAEFIERHNLTVDFISTRATAENFAVELIDHLRRIQAL
jgi:uroporphyrinogen-III synthase